MKDIVAVKAEMRLLSIVDRETPQGRFVKVLFQCHHPDEIENLRTLIGKRFASAMVQIDDDEKPVIQDTPETQDDPATKKRRHLIKLAQIHRNDPPYQAVLMEYFRHKAGYEFIMGKEYNQRDPIDRKNIVARIQHQFCGVESSLAEIKPHSQGILCLKLLEMLYEADKAGLPPPNMNPSAFKQIADLYGG